MAAGDRLYASDFKIGLVGYARRITSSGATIVAEVGYLRMDNIRVFAGRAYEIQTTPIQLKGSVVGDYPEVRLRASNAGLATTASAQLSSVRAYIALAAVSIPVPLTAYYAPALDSTTASFLLSIIRSGSGAGSTGVQVFASGTSTVDFTVKDIGPAVADSGTSL